MTFKQRAILYLYSDSNLLGSLLGIGGLALLFTGIIRDYWLPIVIGLYVIGAIVGRPGAVEGLRLQQEMSSEELRAALEQLVHSIRRKVPKDIFEKVNSIKNTILEILPYLTQVDRANYNLFTIRQTALEYLPETLENYLKLPRAYATLHVVKDGKTAQQLLQEQLDLLDQEMKAVAEDFYRNDLDQLVAHGRFLESKFERSDVLFGIQRTP